MTMLWGVQSDVQHLQAESRDLRTDVDNLLAEIQSLRTDLADLRKAFALVRSRVDFSELVA